MASVRDLLNHVWLRFRQEGVADDLTIIEHVAALLLSDAMLESSNEWQRLTSPFDGGPELYELRRILSQAAEEVGGPAILFDRHILFRLERDGYPAGRGRDLTQDPSIEMNDLPFALGVVSGRDTGNVVTPHSVQAYLKVKLVLSETEMVLGCTIEAENDTAIRSVEWFPFINKSTRDFILIECLSSSDQKITTIQITIDSFKMHVVDNRHDFITKRYGLKETDPNPGTSLLASHLPVPAVALAFGSGMLEPRDIRVLGVAVATDVVRTKGYDLQPERFMSTVEETSSITSPAVLLGNIATDQRTLREQIDRLLGHLQTSSVAEQMHSSQRLAAWINPFGILSETQKAVWDDVREAVGAQEEGRPREFVPEDIGAIDDVDDVDFASRTLALFERMGVLISVPKVNPDTGAWELRYRRIAEGDLWNPGQGEYSTVVLGESP